MSPTPSDPIVPIPPAQTLSYEQSAQLMVSQTFVGRVKTACLRFAVSISDEASTVPAHNTRMKWAAQCLQNPSLMAQQVSPGTTLDPAVQSAGSGIPDAALQNAVEACIDNIM